jgi:hypothetical protein
LLGTAPRDSVAGSVGDIEPSASNLLLYSTLLTNGNWAQASISSVAAYSGASPDGTVSTSSFILTPSASTSGRIQQSVTVASTSTSYVYSVYVSPNSSSANSFAQAVLSGGTGSSPSIAFNAQNGTILSSAGVGASGVQKYNFYYGGVSTTWYRFWFNFINSGSNTSISARLIPDNIAGTASAILFGPQVENSGSCTTCGPSSYIATAAASVTAPAGLRASNVSASGVVQTGAYTVATLPSANVTARAAVRDQLTACPAPGGALVGGGSIVCPVFYNGSAWVGD